MPTGCVGTGSNPSLMGRNRSLCSYYRHFGCLRAGDRGRTGDLVLGTHTANSAERGVEGGRPAGELLLPALRAIAIFHGSSCTVAATDRATGPGRSKAVSTVASKLGDRQANRTNVAVCGAPSPGAPAAEPTRLMCAAPASPNAPPARCSHVFARPEG